MASGEANVKANTDGLDKLLRSLKSEYFVRVGIIGAKAGKPHDKKDKSDKPHDKKDKSDKPLTNAELGTIHEQPNNDSEKMPKRSFLEMPLKLKLNFNESEMKEIKKLAWKSFFIKQNAKPFFERLGAKALDIVIGAFETNGYGEWQAWSTAYEKRRVKKVKGKKKRQEFWLNHNILTQTGRLRRSISFKVMKKK